MIPVVARLFMSREKREAQAFAQTVARLEALFRGRSVALVGNARSLLDKPQSGIEDRQVVVRINRGFESAGARPWIGTRTDVLLVSSGARDEIDGWFDQAPAIVYMSPNFREKAPKRAAGRTLFYPVRWWEELRDAVGARPSTGCMGIDMISRVLGAGELHLYGFDFWRSETSYSGENRPGPHSPGAEEQFARRRVRAENIHL